MGDHAAHQVLEILEVGDLVRLFVRELRDHLLGGAAGHLPGIHRLQRAATRTRAGHGVDAVLAMLLHGSFSSRLRHLDRGQRRFLALVAMAAAGARLRILEAFSTASTPLSTGTR